MIHCHIQFSLKFVKYLHINAAYVDGNKDGITPRKLAGVYRLYLHTPNPMHTNKHTHIRPGEAHLHSTYALGKFPLYSDNLQLSCWGEDKLLARARDCHRTTSDVIKTHTHTKPQSFTARGLSLEVVDGTNHYYLSVGGLTSISLSVADRCRPVGVLTPKPDQFDPPTPSITCFYIWNTVGSI